MNRLPVTIKSLVQGFAQNIKDLKAPDYKESQVRLHYIDPFWELLGWDVRNEQQLSSQDVEVIIEPSMDSVEDDKLRSRMPDYLFRLNGFGRFVVEAKRPVVDLDKDRQAIFQAKRYAWNATIPFAVLTDFEQFRLFDTTLKPSLNDPERGLIREFSLNFPDYPSKWEELLATFGRDAVAGGSLERLRAKIRKVSAGRRLRTVDRMLFDLRGDEPVDRVFLDYLEKYRQRFAYEVFKENKKEFPDADTLHGAAKLTEAVQRLIDRLIFMRVCEDRGITKWGNLRDLLERVSNERGDFYKALSLEFRDLDHEFNGYLFKYHFSDALVVPDDILADFVRNLYPPEAPWDFSVIGDDILGIVYERFLGNVVTVKHNQAVVEKKPEVRHAGGVFYTPRFVVDTIIRRVIGPQIAGKTPAQVLDVKILDPACGSGSFLVAAFQFIIDHCLNAIAANPSLARIPATPRSRKKHKEIAFQDRKKRWNLAPDFKASLLTSCIHGVDIDQQAVEVTIMSLYLKMLEGEMPPRWQQDWLENELLPPLDNNILCGNSLIDSVDFDFYCEDKLGGLFPVDEDVRFRINRFDWSSRTRGFGKFYDTQASKERGRTGFDCIIGNPPYIRVQELKKWSPDECEFYKWKYKSANKGNYDIYVVFVERCLKLLSSEGLLGFIMPNKFMNKDYAENLRKLLAQKKSVRELIHFNEHQVFRGVTTYTAITILQGSPNMQSVHFVSIEKLDDGYQTIMKLDATSQSVPGWFSVSSHVHPNNEKPWVFSSSSIVDALAYLPKLGSLAKIFVGVQTDADDVYYVLPQDALNNKNVVRVKCLLTDKVYDIERAILRPLASGSTVKRYSLASPEHVVIFPFEPNINGRWTVMSRRRLKDDFPLAASFFADEKIAFRLKTRAKGKLQNEDTYWDFIYRKNLGRQHLAKVCVPRLADKMTAAMDSGKMGSAYCLDNVDVCGIIPTDKNLSIELLTGLMNSKLLDYFMRMTIRDRFRGDYLSLNKQFIAPLPIKLPETAAEKKIAGRIIESVRLIMDLKIKLRDMKLSDRERKVLEGEVELDEKRIDDAVFALYGVDGLPETGP